MLEHFAEQRRIENSAYFHETLAFESFIRRSEIDIASGVWRIEDIDCYPVLHELYFKTLCLPQDPILASCTGRSGTNLKLVTKTLSFLFTETARVCNPERARVSQ
jgi:hypothetical protein